MDKFVAHLTNFTSWINDQFGENSVEIYTMISTLKTSLYIPGCDKKILDGFAEGVRPHLKQIMKGDDEYFMTTNILDDDPDNLVDIIKGLWGTMARDQKDRVISDVRILAVLAFLVLKDVDAVTIINKYKRGAPYVV